MQQRVDEYYRVWKKIIRYFFGWMHNNMRVIINRQSDISILATPVW